MKKKVKIAIIDSGINIHHKDIVNDEINGINLTFHNKEIIVDNEINDKLGHGTALYYIIKKNAPFAEIFIVRLFSDSYEIESEYIIYALNYIYKNISCDLINLSLGTTDNSNIHELKQICLKLYKRGTLIISAFDNYGAVSYPAEFDFIIGVDNSFQCKNNNDIEYIESSIVNIRAKGRQQRVAWINPEYAIVTGSSFACGHVTSILAKGIYNNLFKKNTMACALHYLKSIAITNYSKQAFNKCDSYESIEQSNNFFVPQKALIIILNKEIYSLIAFQELLNFEIVGIADVRCSGHVTRLTSDIIQFRKLKKIHQIQNIYDVNWNEDFDTIILGHNKVVSSILNTDITAYVTEKAYENNKNIISFDSLTQNNTNKLNTKNLKYYCPRIDNMKIPKKRFGKLYHISQPIIGVFGTSSSQGKFTIQLLLRKLLVESGYKVGQLGTEPSSLLFSMDQVYHCGYDTINKLTCEENIILINTILNEISIKNPDVIIVGGQSAVAPNAFNNISNLVTRQIELLAATLPDIIFLCVNLFDSIEYIQRTINVIEGYTMTKVIGLVLYPLRSAGISAIMQDIKESENKHKFETVRCLLHTQINLPIYSYDDFEDGKKILSVINEYFQ